MAKWNWPDDAKAEREAVVKWLLAQAIRATEGRFSASAAAFDYACNAIERGEHLNQSGEG